jgi:hypothetical protein
LIDTALPDGGSQKVHIVGAGVVKQVPAQIFLSDVMIRWNKAIQPAAAVADNDP